MEAHKVQPHTGVSDQPPPPYFAGPAAGIAQPAPPQGWQPPPQGYAQQAPPGYHQHLGQPGQPATVIMQPVMAPGTRVILVGNCPHCRIGVLEDQFGICAIILAIVFFPLGVLCCLAMREKRCTHCGRSY